MSQYLETESETVLHSDDADQEITYQEMLVKAGAIEYGDTIQGQAELAAKRAIEATRVQAVAAKRAADDQAKRTMVPVICSCGSMRCGMIRVFGLPEPLYVRHIEPLPSMWVRDPKARRMKQAL